MHKIEAESREIGLYGPFNGKLLEEVPCFLLMGLTIMIL